MESDKFDTFQQLCVAKPNLATEFILDILFIKLELKVDFENKYKNIKSYNLECIVESLLELSIKFINQQTLDIKTLELLFGSEYSKLELDNNFLSFLYSFIITNYDKIKILENKKVSEFDQNYLKNYNINIQTTLSHHNFGALENEHSVILQLNTQKKYTLEFNEKELDEFLIKMKEIYNNIKN